MTGALANVIVADFDGEEGIAQRAGVEEVAMGPSGPRLVSARKNQSTARASGIDLGDASTLVSRPREAKNR